MPSEDAKPMYEFFHERLAEIYNKDKVKGNFSNGTSYKRMFMEESVNIRRKNEFTPKESYNSLL